MKIAILTDIHGNYPALNAVLTDLDSRKSIEHMYCLGDMIGIGPDSNKVVETIKERKDITAIVGNHEEAVLNLLLGKGPLLGHERVAEHHKWVGKHLTKENIEFITNLPTTLEVEIEGQKILITHYHMKEEKREEIDETPSGLKLDAQYKDSSYDLICFGHYAIVEFKGKEMSIQLLGMTYENRAFLKSFEELKVLIENLLLKLFMGTNLREIS